MKKNLFKVLPLVFAMALFFSPSASSQTCHCSGSNSNGQPCSCSCKGACCVCGCGVGTGCACGCSKVVKVSLDAGSTVEHAARTISTATHTRIAVLSGGNQTLPWEVKTTSWQALARLASLPEVRLQVAQPEQQSATELAEQAGRFLPSQPSAAAPMRDFQPASETAVFSLCIHSKGGLMTALDRLSRVTGYAFSVTGSPKKSFTLSANGTLSELLGQLSSASGTSISVLR